MRMAGVDQVILGSDGRSYAVVSVNGHPECRELKSKAFRHLLTHASLKATRKLPTPDAISSVVAVLDANAEFDGEHADVFLRVARGQSGASYFLDLVDRDGRLIEIRADGWEQVVGALSSFAGFAGSLPCRCRRGTARSSYLKKYVNLEEADWPLFVGWLTSALRPVGPHPILVLTGEQGAAKSTMLRVCRRLIDPNASPVRSQPKELRDLMVAARNSWLMVYDNITSLPVWFSNGLCGLATGTGFTIRSLGTDDEEIIFVAQRPIILGGISDFVDKPDLADRSFFLDVPRISRSMRRTEEAFWADFNRDCPLILGSLLDAVSAGMRMLPDVHLSALSRMADAERWGEAVARGLGWAPGTFSNTLGANRAAASESALEESPVAVTLIDLAIRCAAFHGTMQELLQTLTEPCSVQQYALLRLAEEPPGPIGQVAPSGSPASIDRDRHRVRARKFCPVRHHRHGGGKRYIRNR